MPRRTANSESIRKSEIVTVRLDPRLKYLAELAARRQRRPLSSFIEWAVAEALSKVDAYDPNEQERETFADEANALWDVDERDRFVKLALRHSDLLDVNEQRVWKLIRECGALWRGYFKFEGTDGEWKWAIDEKSLAWDRLREHWDIIQAVARGDLHPSKLPTWEKTRTRTQEEAADEEIPF